jgi:hypothetical protein
MHSGSEFTKSISKVIYNVTVRIFNRVEPSHVQFQYKSKDPRSIGPLKPDLCFFVISANSQIVTNSVDSDFLLHWLN